MSLKLLLSKFPVWTNPMTSRRRKIWRKLIPHLPQLLQRVRYLKNSLATHKALMILSFRVQITKSFKIFFKTKSLIITMRAQTLVCNLPLSRHFRALSFAFKICYLDSSFIYIYIYIYLCVFPILFRYLSPQSPRYPNRNIVKRLQSLSTYQRGMHKKKNLLLIRLLKAVLNEPSKIFPISK
jgi:hypothetical protein